MTNIEIPSVCEHLQTFLLRSLARDGTKIAAVDTGWSAVEFVIVLNKGPSLKEFKASFLDDKTPAFVEVGQNSDPHYPLQVEVVCNKCKQGVAWPTPVD